MSILGREVFVPATHVVVRDERADRAIALAHCTLRPAALLGMHDEPLAQLRGAALEPRDAHSFFRREIALARSRIRRVMPREPSSAERERHE